MSILFINVEIAIRFPKNISQNSTDKITKNSRILLAPLCTIYILNIKQIGSAEAFSDSSKYTKKEYVAKTDYA